MDMRKYGANILDLYSDASGNPEKGVGAFCDKEWIVQKWEKKFMEVNRPSIQYLELYGVAIAVLTWIKKFPNRRVVLFCDNKNVCEFINKSTSGCKNCMVLLRFILFESMIRNVRIFAEHVSMKKNGKADALSRLQFERFRSLDGSMNTYSLEVPQQLWPMGKIWLK